MGRCSPPHTPHERDRVIFWQGVGAVRLGKQAGANQLELIDSAGHVELAFNLPASPHAGPALFVSG